jgi:hypothetical protein
MREERMSGSTPKAGLQAPKKASPIFIYQARSVVLLDVGRASVTKSADLHNQAKDRDEQHSVVRQDNQFIRLHRVRTSLGRGKPVGDGWMNTSRMTSQSLTCPTGRFPVCIVEINKILLRLS